MNPIGEANMGTSSMPVLASLYGCFDSVEAVEQWAASKLPITDVNELHCVLAVYRNTLCTLTK